MRRIDFLHFNWPFRLRLFYPISFSRGGVLFVLLPRATNPPAGGPRCGDYQKYSLAIFKLTNWQIE